MSQCLRLVAVARLVAVEFVGEIEGGVLLQVDGRAEAAQADGVLVPSRRGRGRLCGGVLHSRQRHLSQRHSEGGR